jgi:hypothetical protein
MEESMAEPRNISFYGGAPGVIWAAAYMSQRGLLKEYESQFGEIKKNIIAALSYDGLFELAHGATGWGILGEVWDEKLEHESRKYLRLTRKRFRDGLWRLPPPYDHKTKVAWGFAHGVLAPLLFLHNRNTASFIANSLAGKLERPNPGVIGVRTGPGVLPQSAWCYGDAGLGFAISKLGYIHKIKKWQILGNEIFWRGSHGSELYRPVVGLPLCHGLSGMLLMTTLHARFSRQTKSRELARYWLKSLEEEAKYLDDISSPGLLNGLSGVGLAVLASQKPSSTRWTRVMLLS